MQTRASSRIMGYRDTGYDHLQVTMHAAAACPPHDVVGRENPDLRMGTDNA